MISRLEGERDPGASPSSQGAACKWNQRQSAGPRGGMGGHMFFHPAPPFVEASTLTSGKEENGKILEVAQNSKNEQLNHLRPPPTLTRTQEAS